MCKCNPECSIYSINPKTGNQYRTCDSCRVWHKEHFKLPAVKDTRRKYRKTEKAKAYDAAYSTTEKSKALQTAYRKTAEGRIKRRAINMNYQAKKGGNPGRVTWQELDNIMKENIEKYGELSCVYCNTNIENGYQFDHIIPRCSEDCINGVENLALSCKNCNSQKRKSSVEEFMKKKGQEHIISCPNQTNKSLQVTKTTNTSINELDSRFYSPF